MVATNPVQRRTQSPSASPGSWDSANEAAAAAQSSISRRKTAAIRSERRGEVAEERGRSDAVLDRIDAIVPPGTDVGRLEIAYGPPAVRETGLRRREVAARGAA